MEIWKDIVGYEGIYQISNFGRVKSLKGNEKFLKPRKNKLGYLLVALCKSGKRKESYIHRLVAMMFIKNPLNKPYINHIDCNPSNNNMNNLEWCTAKENMEYASKLERMHNTPLIAINLITGEQTYFNSQNEAGRQLNLDRRNICSVLKGRLKKTGNYFFKYAN